VLVRAYYRSNHVTNNGIEARSTAAHTCHSREPLEPTREAVWGVNLAAHHQPAVDGARHPRLGSMGYSADLERPGRHVGIFMLLTLECWHGRPVY
jgi:hypothetical protein